MVRMRVPTHLRMLYMLYHIPCCISTHAPGHIATSAHVARRTCGEVERDAYRGLARDEDGVTLGGPYAGAELPLPPCTDQHRSLSFAARQPAPAHNFSPSCTTVITRATLIEQSFALAERIA